MVLPSSGMSSFAQAAHDGSAALSSAHARLKVTRDRDVDVLCSEDVACVRDAKGRTHVARRAP